MDDQSAYWTRRGSEMLLEVFNEERDTYELKWARVAEAIGRKRSWLSAALNDPDRSMFYSLFLAILETLPMRVIALYFVRLLADMHARKENKPTEKFAVASYAVGSGRYELYFYPEQS